MLHQCIDALKCQLPAILCVFFVGWFSNIPVFTKNVLESTFLNHKINWRAGETDQWLGAHTALARDPMTSS